MTEIQKSTPNRDSTQRLEAPPSLPGDFLTASELSQSTNQIVSTMPVNMSIGQYNSIKDYLSTHYQLLRYDSYSGLHYSVQFYQQAIIYRNLNNYTKDSERRKLAR